MTPSIAALLGRWFWWPQRVRARPASTLLRSVGPRPVVRALLLREPVAGNGHPIRNGTTPRANFTGRIVVGTMPGQERVSTERSQPPFTAQAIHRFSVLVILAWVALTLIVTLGVPSLETVGREHSVSLCPKDAPSVQAMMRMGKDFKESNSDSSAMVVLEGQRPLAEDARAYYAGLVRELRDDSKHVQHVQDYWGDRLTATGAQSPDGKAVYIQLNLAGNQGTTLGDESVAAVRNIVQRTPPPPGVTVSLTGAAPLVSDMQRSGNDSLLKITAVTGVVIFAILLVVYRSITTVILLLLTVRWKRRDGPGGCRVHRSRQFGCRR